MDSGFDLRAIATEVTSTLVASVADVVPRALTAIVIIIIGLLFAKLAERAVRGVFDRLKIDAFLERIGISQMLNKVGLKDAPGRVLGRAIYFLLVILFTQAVTQAVGLHAISGAIGSFFSYLPSVVAAFLVLLLGMMVAQVVARAVTESASGAGIDYAPLLGRLTSTVIIFVVVIMSISQLRIDTEIIHSMVIVLSGGLAVALALSFGLGTREVTRNLVAAMYARRLLKIGQEVEFGGERGVLTGITPVQVLIRRGEETVAVPCSVFLDQVTRQ